MSRTTYFFYKKTRIKNVIFVAWTGEKDLADLFSKIRSKTFLVVKKLTNEEYYSLRDQSTYQKEIVMMKCKTKRNGKLVDVDVPMTVSEMMDLTLGKQFICMRELQKYALFPIEIFSKDIQEALKQIGYADAYNYSEEIPEYAQSEYSGIFENVQIDELALYFEMIKDDML